MHKRARERDSIGLDTLASTELKDLDPILDPTGNFLKDPEKHIMMGYASRPWPGPGKTAAGQGLLCGDEHLQEVESSFLHFWIQLV